MSLERATRELTTWIDAYYGDGIWLMLMCFSIIYLYVRQKKFRNVLVYPTLLIGCLVCNVIFYRLICMHIIYWRLFWMLPTCILIALAILELIKDSAAKRKIILILFTLFLVFGLGTRVFNESTYYSVQNSQKVSLATKRVCDLILADYRYPLCIFPNEMYSEVRQYSGDIRLVYGRDAEGYIIGNQKALELGYALNNVANAPVTAAQVARCCECQYVVLRQECPEFENYGYKLFGVVEGYYIYKDEMNVIPKWTITLHAKNSSRIMRIQDVYNRKSYIVEGKWGDIEDIREVISQHGNVAYDWMTTSMCDMYCTASAHITLEPNGIIIFDKYRPGITDISYDEVIGQSGVEFNVWAQNKWNEIANYEKRINSKSDEKFAGLKLTVYNDEDEVEDDSTDLLSDASVVIKLEGQKKSMLYVSNVTSKQLEKIINKHQDALKANYLVIRNDHMEDFSSLVKVVEATEVYNYYTIKEDISFEIE